LNFSLKPTRSVGFNVINVLYVAVTDVGSCKCDAPVWENGNRTWHHRWVRVDRSHALPLSRWCKRGATKCTAQLQEWIIHSKCHTQWSAPCGTVHVAYAICNEMCKSNSWGRT